MYRGIHFLAEDLLGALDRQRSDLLAQRLASLDRLLLGFGLGSRNDLRRFVTGAKLGFLDDRGRTLVGVCNALRALLAGLGQLARASRA